MRRLFWTSALALFAACATPSSGTTDDPTSNPGDDGEVTLPPDAPPPPSACPMGLAAYDTVLGLSGATDALDVAALARGGVAVAGAAGTKMLSPSGEVQFSFPFGSVLASDRAGNLYVAGGYSAPIDFGNGTVLVPADNIDTFVAKIDARGQVVFARDVTGLCGEGVSSLAIAADGRIAISGTALGTVVLSADASEIQFSLAASGDVAFDGQGRLAIAGNAPDGFVTLVDRAGLQVYEHALVGADHVMSVAVDSDDNIVFAGYTTRSADILGKTILARYAGEAGRIGGAFLAKLDVVGNAVFVAEPSGSEANGVAVGAGGQIAVNGAMTGNTGFFRIASLDVFTPTGALRQHREQFVASGDARGYGVAMDACGSVYAGFDALDTPSPASPLRAHVVKVSP